MKTENNRLFLIQIASEHTKRLRPVRVFAPSYDEAIYSLELKPFEHIRKHREMKGLERFLEDIICPKPKEKDIACTFQKIVRLLKVNTPIEKAFKIQLPTVKSWKTRFVFQSIVNSVSRGETLSGAFNQQKGVFSKAFISMLKSAEKSSEVPKVLLKIGQTSQRQERIRKKLVGEMIYPGIVLSTVAIAFVMLICVFLPQVKGIYDDLGAKMPVFTEFLYQISVGLRSNPVIASVFAGVGIFGLFKAFRKFKETELFEKVLYKLPRVGPFLLNRNVITTFEYLAMMQSSSVPIEDALVMASDITSSKQMKGVCKKAALSVSNGNSLSEALWEQFHLLGNHAQECINAIEIGELSGNVEENLNSLVDGLQEEQEYEVNNFGKLLGPVITLFLAGVACVIILTFLLPLVQITDAFTKGAGL